LRFQRLANLLQPPTDMRLMHGGSFFLFKNLHSKVHLRHSDEVEALVDPFTDLALQDLRPERAP
jgi:hypothetical protein